MLIPGKKAERCRVCNRQKAERESPYCWKCIFGTLWLICSELRSGMCYVGWSRTGVKRDTILFEIDVGPYERLFKTALLGRVRPKRFYRFRKLFAGQVEFVRIKITKVVEEPDQVIETLRTCINKYPVKLNGLLKRYWSFDLKESQQGSSGF